LAFSTKKAMEMLVKQAVVILLGAGLSACGVAVVVVLLRRLLVQLLRQQFQFRVPAHPLWLQPQLVMFKVLAVFRTLQALLVRHKL
jgi:hypothetical protein